MKAVVLAGGEGLRLRPLTLNTPKPMVPVLNRPFLEHTLDYLRRHGVAETILTLSYLPHRVQGHFGQGEAHGLRLHYSVEARPLGTAGAVKAVASLLDGTFLVLNGDLFTSIDLSGLLALHRERRAMATIALIWVEDPTPFGMVETDAQGRVLRFVEKPLPEAITTHYINGGIYALEPEALALAPADTPYMFEDGLFPRLLAEGWPVYSYPSATYWLDVGTPQRYLQLHHDLLLGRCPSLAAGDPQARGGAVHATARLEGPVLLGEGCVVGPGARVVGPVVLGPGCRLGRGAVVEETVLWAGVRVGAGATLSRCLIGAGCRLGAGVAAEGVVMGDDVAVPSGQRLPNGATLGGPVLRGATSPP